MKVCVTGNLGFIGRALEKELLSIGYDVVGFDKSDWEDIYSLIEWRRTINDFLDENNPKAVFHVGACSDTLNQDYNEMMKLNSESTLIISEWCVKKDVPIIYSSSASCYGFGDGPLTLYAWSKFIGEQYVKKNDGVSLRYFNVYGFDESHKGKMASVAYQSHVKVKNGQPIHLFPLKPRRDFVYINDVISANIYALENYEKLSGGVYDVGSGQARYFEEVMDIMGIEYNIANVCDISIPKGYQYYTKANENKFMSGWNPKWNLEDGLNDYKKYL